MKSITFSTDDLLHYLRGDFSDEKRREMFAVIRENPEYLDMLDGLEEKIQRQGLSIFDDYRLLRKALDNDARLFCEHLMKRAAKEDGQISWCRLENSLGDALAADFENFITCEQELQERLKAVESENEFLRQRLGISPHEKINAAGKPFAFPEMPSSLSQVQSCQPSNASPYDVQTARKHGRIMSP